VTTIEVADLRKEFPGGDSPVIAIEGISFKVSGPEFVSVVGPSGCGKSTLLNILSGVESASGGTVGITAGDRPARLGYVFQAARLLPWRSVMDNLLFVQQRRDQETRRRCERYLDMVKLRHTAKQFPGQLSGGMQQRIGIARAFSIEPDVLLMDEPFSHLDAITARSLRRELHTLWQETQKTVLFVTHDVSEAVELSTRILMLGRGGTLVADIPVELPYPRDPASDAVALARANLLRRFESLDLLAT
jgi:NitT/TauT family transport system ATP-binding protein